MLKVTSRTAWRLFRVAACVFAVWATARVVFQFLPRQDAVAAMLLLLCVLAIATLGDRVLAVTTSLAASISFSYYFIDNASSFAITSTEGAVTFVGMLITALTGSQLSLRVQTRAAESERRRAEMERLQRLGVVLLTANTVTEASGKAIREIVAQFGGGAILRVEGIPSPFYAGVTDAATLQVMGAVSSGVFLKQSDPDQFVTPIHGVRTRTLNAQILVDHSRSRIEWRSSQRQIATHS